MMKQIRDERVVQLTNQILSEAYFVISLFLLGSIAVKAYVLGQPFTQRIHFMERLCRKAHVKPFGFHAIRHKSAAITFVSSGLNAAQVLMGHYRATTTDRYTKSAGLYTDQSEILSALGGSGIGQVVEDLLKTKIPQEKVS